MSVSRKLKKYGYHDDAAIKIKERVIEIERLAVFTVR
jgi:hypothetical protein